MRPAQQGDLVGDADRSIAVRIVAVDPPFQDGHGVLFGLQGKGGDVDPVPATSTTTFETTLELVVADDHHDFRGPHVVGRKGDRFIYLSWGLGDGVEPFVMFARAKLKLADIPAEVLSQVRNGEGTLDCSLEATNTKGQPASGTIKPPAVGWSVRR